jgi:hypothetical protein
MPMPLPLPLPFRTVPAADPALLLKQALTQADEHLLAYGHDMGWLTGDRRFDGTCRGCHGRAVVHLDGRGAPRVTVEHGGTLQAPGKGDYAECQVLRRRSFGRRLAMT